MSTYTLQARHHDDTAPKGVRSSDRHDLNADQCRRLKREIRSRLAKETDGIQCVTGTYGDVDIVSVEEVIEVKYVCLFAQALGKVHGHHASFPTKHRRVHLFGTQDDLRGLDKIRDLFTTHDVRLTHEVVTGLV